MLTGKRSGAKALTLRAPSVSLFIADDGGYTTVAMAVALLVCLTLVFSAASAEWAMARSAEVQEVADASALAGSNCVAAFSTVYQVLDACVLSLGLSGVMVLGAGMVVSSIPFVQAKAPAILASGRQILTARKGFATSAAKGLSRLEKALPALIMANSASCVSANCRGGMEYVGCAIPFPQTSETDYSFLDDGIDGTEIEESAQQLREATARKEKALKRADEAKQRAWTADCVDSPMCMRSRARTLAGLGGSTNPNYLTADAWKFEYARVRALNYYRTRLGMEAPKNDWPEELSRSAARRAFYEYASDAIAHATCVEGDHAFMDLPDLPHNSATVRESSLYTDALWPCTTEGDARTLHSTLACPGATGPSSGYASLSELEQGSVAWCETCGMDVGVMGGAANASTNIDNGFEHYWRIVVDASKDYAAARKEAREAEEEMRTLAEKSSNFFKEAMEQLSVDRPKIKPAGAYGCVSVVVRKSGTSVPHELTASFLSGAELPPGVAISAAALAPDGSTDGGTVLSRAFDGLKEGWGAPVEFVGNVTELWGKLLVGYGSSYERVSGVANNLFDGVGALFGETVATWLRGKVQNVVDTSGLAPTDMRLRKPVLVRSQLVLDQAGMTTLGQARTVIQELPSSADQISSTNWTKIIGELGGGDFTVAELPIPGIDGASIPLTIDLSKLAGAS